MSQYRYERKFSIKSLTINQVELIIKYHKANFSEVYLPRIVNNIYFDTVSMSNFENNLDGSLRRNKVRIRWYGPTFGYIRKPILEVKQKVGLLGSKIKHPLKPFYLDENFNQKYINGIIFKSKLPNNIEDYLKFLRVSLLNSYYRKYYKSVNHKFRLTMDNNLKYFKIKQNNNNYLCKYNDQKSVIVELKYKKIFDNGADYVTNGFPFRLTKNSKYYNGIEKFYN